MNQTNPEPPQADSTVRQVVWSSMHSLDFDPMEMEESRIVAFSRSNPAALAFDMLRTKVLRSIEEDAWRSLGITSPTSGCGKATVALNLAVSLSKQADLRVVLVDLDLRRPRIASILGLSPDCTMREFLTDGWQPEQFFIRVGPNLAVGASNEVVEHPAELLLSKKTVWKLKRLQQGLGTNVVIYNLPPMLTSDDCAGFLPHLDRALLVVGAEHSTLAEIDVCERELSEESKLLGVVLNKCRYKTEQFDNYQA